MIKKCVLPVALLMFSMMALTGCNDNKNVDAYLTTSLRNATYGTLAPSKGYKYKIVNPVIVEAVGHLCLVREGNVTELIVGRSIADKMATLETDQITFNVVKKYSPYLHFKCEQMVAGTDTLFMPQAGSIYFPVITEVADFRSKDHDDINMNRFRYNDTAGLRKMEEKQFGIKAQVARIEEDGDEVWMLIGPRGNLRIARTNDHTEMVLRLLARENLEFEGGITFDVMEDWPARRNNNVCGDVTVDFITYMNRVFSG